MNNFGKVRKYPNPDDSRISEYLAIFTCSIFCFSIGTTLGWVAPTIVKFLEPDSPVPFSPGEMSTMVAVTSVGHLIATLSSNLLVDRIGRRRTLLLSGLPVIVSSAMIMSAKHAWVVHIARILVGYSMGMCLCVTPMYMGEVSTTYGRGLAGSMIGIMINLGVLFAYSIAPYLSIFNFAGLMMMVGLVFEVSFWWMPETPYYLAMVGSVDEAEAVLEKLRGRKEIAEEMMMIEEEILKSTREGKKAVGGSLRDLFTERKNLRGLAIAMSFLVAQHFGGYFMILAYGELIFKVAGDVIPSHWAIIALGVSQLLSNVASGLLVDRIGRKPLILGSGVIGGFATAVIGVYLYFREYTNYDLQQYSAIFLVAMLIEASCFNCGLLSIHMVIMSEMFATEVKGIAMAVNGTCSAVLGIISHKLYIAIAITWAIGHSPPFFVFTIVTWASTILLVFITPETKGKSFIQIQEELSR